MWFVLLPRQQIFFLRSFFYLWLLNSQHYKNIPPYQTHSIFYKLCKIKWINYSTYTKLLSITTSESWFERNPTSITTVDKQIITQYWGWPVFYLKVSNGFTPSPSCFIIHITVFHQLWYKSFLNLFLYVSSKVNVLHFSIFSLFLLPISLIYIYFFFHDNSLNTKITGPQDCSRSKRDWPPLYSLLTVWFTRPFETHQLWALLSLCHPKTEHFSKSPLNSVSAPHHFEIFTVKKFFAVKNFKQILT